MKLIDFKSRLDIIEKEYGNVDIELHFLILNGEFENYQCYTFEFNNDDEVTNDEIYKILGKPSITSL